MKSFKRWREWREEEGKAPEVESEPETKVDPTLTKINEATKEELLEIKGIGPKTADKILQQQPCQNLDELQLVASVKEKLIKWASS